MTSELQLDEEQRFEVKFVTQGIYRKEIIQWLKIGPGNCYSPHPSRWINNIYWDSHALTTVDDHLLGNNRRNKVRYRWYGENDFCEPGQLEIKLKHNVFNHKARYPVPDPFWKEGQSWKEMRSGLSAQLPDSGKWILKQYSQPTLGNKYHRSYFSSRDHTVRVTLDSKLWTCPQRFHSKPELPRPTGLENLLIVEFKFSKEDSDRASDIMQTVPIRPSRSSKFIQGLYSFWL